MQAVKFDEYGSVEVLDVREVPDPVAGPGQVVVRVKAAGINPGENAIRQGLLHERWPATFPSGQGSDVAGVVEAVGEGVTSFAAGDEVLGYSHDRATQAELVAVPAGQLTRKPQGLSWEVAGSLYVGPTAGYAGVVAVDPQPGETVVVSAAAGGAGGVAAQLARLRGARVIGLASERNHDWLRSRGIEPVPYGDGQADRIRALAGEHGVDALIDNFGGGYVDLAIELGVAPDRINTIIDWDGAERTGAKAEGNAAIGDIRDALAQLAAWVVAGDLEIPVERTYPLADVREAFTKLAERHTRGKLVLIP